MRLTDGPPVVGVVLHIFHEPVGIDILERLLRLGRDFRLFVTASIPISNEVRSLAKRVRADAWLGEVLNRGRDVEPFLSVLPRLKSCDYVIKLHSKDNSTPLTRAWYREMVDALIGSPEVYDAILEEFERTPYLRMVGPKETYISAQRFMYENRAAVERLQEVLWGHADKEDWGFFAGTMFWFRRAAFSAIECLCCDGLTFEDEVGGKDGKPEHAWERFFSYHPKKFKIPVAACTNTPNGPVIELDPLPSTQAITRYLSVKHGLAT